jgi:hypothetical protein
MIGNTHIGHSIVDRGARRAAHLVLGDKMRLRILKRLVHRANRRFFRVAVTKTEEINNSPVKSLTGWDVD